MKRIFTLFYLVFVSLSLLVNTAFAAYCGDPTGSISEMRFITMRVRQVILPM
ncbi:MAG: hypothetical protein IPP32_00320 [Bacteroidetes bacterium]|nr:hypothetical protein [Bacteroidota bacterium]